MSVVTRSDERYGARMVRAIRVSVNAFVQLRRDAEHERPKKSGADKGRDDQPTAIEYTRSRVHLRGSLCPQPSLRKIFLELKEGASSKHPELSRKWAVGFIDWLDLLACKSALSAPRGPCAQSSPTRRQQPWEVRVVLQARFRIAMGRRRAWP